MTKTPLTTSSHSEAGLLTEQDLYLFNEGRNYRTYEKLGAHLTSQNGEAGTSFSVWAPNAKAVSLIGTFNGWDPRSHPLRARESSGIWEGFIPGVTKGSVYKFHIVSNHHGLDTLPDSGSRRRRAT